MPDTDLKTTSPTALRRRGLLLTVPTLLTPGLATAAEPPRGRTIMATTPIARTDIKWWRDRHEAKLVELKTKRPELVFYGDSITQQWEYTGPPDWRDYQPIWQRFYGRRNAVNLGFKGDTTSSLIWRIRNGEATGISPRAAVILIGANHLGRLKWGTEDTVAGIDQVLRDLRQRLPSTRLLLLGILPSERSAWATETTLAVNRVLATKYPKGHEVTFMDLGHLFMRDGRFDRTQFYDPYLKPPDPTMHPTPQANARMAEAMEPPHTPQMKK